MKAFDIPTDSKIYEILTVHENDFVDIKEVGGEGTEHHFVDCARIRIV